MKSTRKGTENKNPTIAGTIEILLKVAAKTIPYMKGVRNPTKANKISYKI